MLTQSQINFNYSLITGSDSEEKVREYALSQTLVKLNNVTNNTNKHFHD